MCHYSITFTSNHVKLKRKRLDPSVSPCQYFLYQLTVYLEATPQYPANNFHISSRSMENYRLCLTNTHPATGPTDLSGFW